MRKAFTMIELVFVIVIVGILSLVISSSFERNTLREAADQVVSHIRYTQHLAMVDDKFVPNPEMSKESTQARREIDVANWFMRRWTIRFQENLVYTTLAPNKTYNKIWAYTIFTDLPNFTGHNPDILGMAKNPQNNAQYLSGGYDNTLHVESPSAMKKLQLGMSYGVQDVTFSGGCRSNVLYLHFDYLGRPMNSFPTTHPYELAAAGWHKLLQAQCRITLCDGDCANANSKKIVIGIEPESGYTHIL